MRFRVRPVRRLAGSADVPGDKSVSHRAALLGAIADGATEIHGYLEAEDCLRTITAVQALGAAVTRKGPGHYRIEGAGRHGLHEPTEAEFDSVRREFDLHELAVEDAITAHQRPKLEVYGDTLLVVLKPARQAGPRGSIEFGEILDGLWLNYLRD